MADHTPADERDGLRELGLDPASVPAADPHRQPEGFVVEVGGERIHFLDWGRPDRGDEMPGILLIHGLGQTAWTWSPVARRFATVTHVVAMDLRGHGLSDAPTEGYEPYRLAEDAIAVIEGAGLDDRGVVLAGHGFGAIVAAWACGALDAEGEGRGRGLVLVDGGWEDVAETTGMSPGEWLRGLDEPPEVLRSMTAFLADRRGFDPATWDADQERAARATVVEVPAGHLLAATRPHTMAAIVRSMFEYRPSDVLPGLAGPVAALQSDDPEGVRTRDLRAVGRARAAAGHGPIAFAAYPGTGHNLMRYRPDEVAGAILAVARTIAR